MLVLIITFRDGGGLRTEAYGPWTAQADGSHIDEIAAFAGRLADMLAEGTRELVDATVHALTPPNEAT